MSRDNRSLIKDALEDLGQENFIRFCDTMREPRNDELRPARFRRAQVDDRSPQEVADLLEHAFSGQALEVTLRLLRTLDCLDAADRLEDANRKQARAKWGKPKSPPSPKKHQPQPETPQHFVDRHQYLLMERVSNTRAILDYLLQKRVVHQQQYDTAMDLSTPQAQMAFLYGGPLRMGGTRSKDVLVSALQKLEPRLMQDLW